MKTCIKTDMTPKELMDMLCGEVDDTPVYVRIRSLLNNLYLTAGVNMNSVVTQQGYINNDLQLWYFTVKDAPSRTYYVYNKATNRVLSVANNSTKGSNILTSNQASATTQQWKIFERIGGGYYALENAMTGLVVDIPNNSKEVGIGLVQYNENSGNNQRYSFYIVNCKDISMEN